MDNYKDILWAGTNDKYIKYFIFYQEKVKKNPVSPKKLFMRHPFLKGLLAIVLLILLMNSSYSYFYKINELSAYDGVFKDFRESILFHNTQLLWRRQYYKGRQHKNNSFLRLKMAHYTVKKGETLNSITRKLYLDTDTLISLNSLSSPYDIYKGKEILIPNMRGIIHKVKQTTNLRALSAHYQIPGAILYSINKLKNEELYQGQKLFIPYKKLSKRHKRYFSRGIFLFPVSGRLSSRFGLRIDPFNNRRTFHGGVDIAARTGTLVYASQGGQVIFSGYMGGYGNLIIVRHKYGYNTFYGHLSRRLYKKGHWVRKGQVIGKVGSTGRCTGPNLHFEIRQFNLRKNPLKFTHF